MPGPLVHELRVRYGECDAQGIVFNAHYLAYFDINITELWRAAFGSYQAMTDRGIDVVVVEARVRFSTPARFDDLLTLQVGVARLGTTSISTRHVILRDQELVAEGEVHHVLVELPTLAKTAIPDWVRAPLAGFAVDAAAGFAVDAAAANAEPAARAADR
jgi:acyl-CoA thioester hydrolase